MAIQDVLVLDPTAPSIGVPALADTYHMPRSLLVSGDIEITGVVKGPSPFNFQGNLDLGFVFDPVIQAINDLGVL